MTHCISSYNGIGWREKAEPVCGTCGSDNISIDPKWCYECGEYVDLTTREKWLRAHPEDATPEGTEVTE